MTATKTADRVVGRVSRALVIAAGTLVTILIVLMAAEIVARYFFGSPLRGSYELLGTWILPMSIILAMPYTFRTRGHVRIDMMVARMPGPARRVVGYVAWALSLVVVFALAAATTKAALDTLQAGATSSGLLRLDIWPVYAVASVSLVVLGLEIVMSGGTIGSGDSVFVSTVDDAEIGS